MSNVAGFPVSQHRWVGGARFFYFIGAPYLAIILGLLTPSQLGLTGLDFFTFIDVTGSALFLQLQQAMMLMFLSWLLDLNATLVAGLGGVIVLAMLRWGIKRQGVALVSPNLSILEIIYAGLHWAFFRAIFWALTGDLYLGAISGIIAVMLEWALIYRLQDRNPLRQQQFLSNTLLLLLTSTVFFYSPNLWLLLPVHWVMVVTIFRT